MPEVRIEIRDINDKKARFDVEIFDSNSFPLSLTYSNFDIRDISSRKGGFSKSFKIPATKNNNIIFNHLYFDGIVDTNNMKSRREAIIYVENLPIITGHIQATKVIKGAEVEAYECVFFGDNMSWASEIKDAKLSALSLGTETYINPTGTWANTYTDKIVYPLCTVGEGDNDGNGVLDSDFIPHVFVKTIWDKIFSSITNKYAISSTFCDSAFFKSLVMPLNFERERDTIDQYSGKAIQNADEELIKAFYNRTGAVSRGDSALVSATYDDTIENTNSWIRGFWFRANTQDDSSIYENADTPFQSGNIVQSSSQANFPATFKVNQDGSYTISMNMNIEITVTDEPDFNGVVRMATYAKLYTSPNGLTFNEVTDIGDEGTIGYAAFDLEKFFDPITHTMSGSVTLNNLSVGTQFYAMIFVQNIDYGTQDSGSYSFNAKSGSFLQGMASPTIVLGEDYTINELLPQKTQLEFVKGVAQLFNLQFYTDATSNTVYVEPYDYFYKDVSTQANARANALNWSDKLDTSKGIEEEFVHDIKKKIVLSYSGEDGLTERFNKRNNYEYASYEQIDTTGTFFDGVFELSNDFFEATFMINEGDYVQTQLDQAPLVPAYWNSYSNVGASLFHIRPDKSFDTGSRVLIYRGSTASTTTKFDYLGTTIGGTPVATTTWGRAVFTDWEDTSNISDGHQSIDLNLAYTSYTDGSSNTVTHHGLYKNYYSKMIEQLRQRPRIKIAYFKLNSTDVMNFDFRRLVYLDGVFYRVNKIVDYKPHRNESTKVELVEFTETGTGTISTQTDEFRM